MTSELASLLGIVIDGRYRIDRVVGEGGFGTVYAAWHLALGIPIALKVLKLDPSVRSEKRNQLLGAFLDEGRVLTRLKHPHIISALDLGTITNADQSVTPYLVMEWCEGSSLRSMIDTRGRLPLAEAYAIVERLADALGHAHAMGVTHRDLKPGNVMMVSQAGTTIPRLIDFGIAKLVDPGSPQDSTATRANGQRAFTPAYAAPEQVAGGRTGPRTDVHALGLLFITMVTGERPYGYGDDCNLAVIDTVRPTAERPDIDTGAFAAVIAQAVAARPQERYADAHALRDALRAAAREQLGEVAPLSRLRSAPPRDQELMVGPAGSVTPAGNTVTEQATATSIAPRHPSAAPSARRARRMWVLGATAIAIGAAMSMFYFARVPTEIAPSEPTPVVERAPQEASSALVNAPEKSQTFCELPEEDKKSRTRATGLRGYGWHPSAASPELTSLLDPTAAWLTVTATEVSGNNAAEWLAAAKLFLSSCSEAIDLLPDRGIAYAMQENCLLAVRGRTAETTRVLSALVGAQPVDLRGDSFGGPRPIPFAMIASAKWNGTKARALSELTQGELLERVRAAGVEISDARRVGNALSLSIRKETFRGTALYYKDPNIRTQLPALTRNGTIEAPIYSASDGEVVVIADGPKGVVNDQFFARVVNGLGARTVKSAK